MPIYMFLKKNKLHIIQKIFYSYTINANCLVIKPLKGKKKIGKYFKLIIMLNLRGLFLLSSNNDEAEIPDNTHARTKFPLTFRSIDEGISQRTTIVGKTNHSKPFCRYVL